MPSSRIVACDQDITRINSTAPESEGIRLRKVEAAARGFDLGQGDVSVLEARRITSVAATAEADRAGASLDLPGSLCWRNLRRRQFVRRLRQAQMVLQVRWRVIPTFGSNPLIFNNHERSPGTCSR